MNDDKYSHVENESAMAADAGVALHTASYTDIMSYLHSIYMTPEVKASVGRRLVVEATEPYIANAFSRLDQLSLLKDGWDGRNAKKISNYVLSNLKQVLLISDNIDWKYWTISPAPNGSIALQSKTQTSAISIGDKEFSYYSFNGNAEKGESHIKFTPSSFLNVMRKIA